LIESVVLVPALDVGQPVRDLRLKYDPSAAAGVRPHITLMFPVVPPPDLSEPAIETLETLISGTTPFQFSLTGVNQFHQGTVAILESASGRQQIATQLSELVPIVIEAEEAWLMVGSNAGGWKVVRQMRFRD
jgi:2'-5' RNA ligase